MTKVFLLINFLAVAAGYFVIRRMAIGGAPASRIAWIVLPSAAAISLFVFFTGEPKELFGDYWSAYFPAGKAVFGPPQTFDALYAHGVQGFVNLPIIAYLFYPLTLVSANVALTMLFAIGFVAAATSWIILVRTAQLDERVALLLLFLLAANGPLINGAKEVNTSHILLPFLAGALSLFLRRRDFIAGALLALSALLKLPLMLFGLYFLLRRRWHALLGFAVVGALVGLLSLALFGLETHLQWLLKGVLAYSRDPLPAFNVQSIPAYFARLETGRAGIMSWVPHHLAATSRVLSMTIVLLCYAAAVWVLLKPVKSSGLSPSAIQDEALSLEYSLVLILACVASPLSWTHYYVWMLIPIAFLIGPARITSESSIERKAIDLAIIAVSLGLYHLAFRNELLEALYVTVGSSYSLFGGILLLVVVLVRRAALARSTDDRLPST